MVEDIGGRQWTPSCSCRRSSTCQDPGRGARPPCASWSGRSGVAYVSTPNVLSALAGRRRALRQSLRRVREYRPDEYRALCERHLGHVELLGPVPRPAAPRSTSWAIEHAGWDAVHARLPVTKPFYARFTPAISVRDFEPAPRRGSSGPPRPGRRPAAMTPRGALALVLHTHMPYVEGFGTWPFGEEWLWEALRRVLPPAARRARRGARPRALRSRPCSATSSRRRGRSTRCLAFLREVRPASHALDLPATPTPGRRPRWRTPPRRTPGPRTAGRRGPGAWRRTRRGPRPPPTRSCRCWRRRRRPAPARDRDRGAPGAVRRVGRRALAAGVRARAVARPAARGGRGAGGLRRPHRCARRAASGRCAPPAGPLLVPLDRPLLELVWSRDGYPSRGAYRDTHRLTERRHQAWAVAGGAYEPERAAARAQADAAAFVAPRRRGSATAGWRRRGRHGAARPALARGPALARRGARGAGGAGLRIAPLDELAEAEAEPAPLDAARRGARRGPRHLERPRAAGLAWRQRDAELRALAPGGRSDARCASCSRSGLRLGVPADHGYRRDYPRERAAGHEAAFEAALAGRADPRCAGSPRTSIPRCCSQPDRTAATHSVREGRMLSDLKWNQPSPRTPQVRPGAGSPDGA